MSGCGQGCGQDNSSILYNGNFQGIYIFTGTGSIREIKYFTSIILSPVKFLKWKMRAHL